MDQKVRQKADSNLLRRRAAYVDVEDVEDYEEEDTFEEMEEVRVRPSVGRGRGSRASNTTPSGGTGSGTGPSGRAAKAPRTKGPMDAFFTPDPVEVVSKRKMKQTTLNEKYKKEEREKVAQHMARWFYQAGIPFNTTRLDSYRVMVEAIGQFGPGLTPASYHELRVPLLQKEVAYTDALMAPHKEAWARYGCSLMADGWTDRRGRTLINFLVNSTVGTYFLESVGASSFVKTAILIKELFEGMLEKVGVQNVVQVVTDNAANYALAGQLLMDDHPTLFWTPCAAHCIDLMLHDICKLPIITRTVKRAIALNGYIYNHPYVLNMMRTFTEQRELIRLGVTRFATVFLTLQSIYNQKNKLRRMFASEEWSTSRYHRDTKGKDAYETVMSVGFWNNITYSLKATGPLVKVLRFVDSEKKPAMGYIYEAMDRAKEAMAKSFNYNEAKYYEIWEIIDKRWNDQLHRPLHAAGYYLNPEYFYTTPRIENNEELNNGFLDTLRRLVPDEAIQDRVETELSTYRYARGIMGSPNAIRNRALWSPADWWMRYGSSAPNLQQLAVKVLSLTCSSSGCERNWSAFEHNDITLSDVPVEWIPAAHCSLEFFESSLLGKQTSQRRLSGGIVGNDLWSEAECLSTTLMDVPVKLIEGPLHCFLQERTVQDTVNFKVDQEGLKCTVPEVGAHNMIVTRAISGRKASKIDNKSWHPVNNLSDECCPRAIVEYCTHFTKNKKPSTRELEDKLTIVTLSSKTPKRRNLRRALITKDISNRGYPSRFLRSSKSGLQVVEGPGLGQHATLTVLSWLIDNNVILPRQKISYHLKRDRLVKAEGMITREGIKCKCCNKVYSLSRFEAHAGGNSERPANNTFLPDGRSILQCQMQLVHAKKVSGEMLDPIGRVRGDYSRYNSDNICSVCHYGGELVLCSYCPTSFHLSCIGLQDVSHGQWCCPSCRCSICGQSEYNVDIQCFTPQSILCCDQCDREYHVGCLVKRGEKKLQNCPWGNWFCSRKCSKIYHYLWKRIGKSKPTCAKGLSWSILRPRNQSSCLRDTSTTETMAEHHSKLWVALSLLHECFVPIVQSRTKRDLFTDVLFNNWSELNRLNFRGFYTVLLERDDEIISVAAIRVHGDKVAEMPLVATHIPYRHQGMCRLLVKEIEKMLYDLGVERLILPAVPQLLETWTTSFGFTKLSHFDRLELLEYTFLDFQDSIMCQKILIPSITKAKKQRGKAEAGDMPTRTNVEMGYKLHDVLTNIEPIAMLRSDNLLVCPSHCEAGTNTKMCLDLEIPIRDYEHIKRTETEEQLSLKDYKCKSSVVSGYIDVAAPAGTEQKIVCLNRFRGLSYSRRGKRCSSKEALLENTNERRFKRDTFKYYTRRVARDKSLA